MTTCDVCGSPAVFHDTRVFDGKTKTVNLCEEHAIAAGVDIGPHSISIKLTAASLGDLVSATQRECPDCGMTISAYKDKALLGCPECYVTFEDQLLPVIASLQEKRTQHVGRTPRSASADMDRHIAIRRLLTQLERAVTQEAYEEAADIRDTLRDLHKGSDDDEI